jgi:hypothetical protein
VAAHVDVGFGLIDDLELQIARPTVELAPPASLTRSPAWTPRLRTAA